MGVFNPAVVTAKGQALLAKTVAGTCKMQFTRMALSNATPITNLSAVTVLDSIKQVEYISYLGVKDATTVTCEVAFTNKDLEQGYYVRTIGVYANDPDEGEILYCISTANETSVTADWMPPFTGTGVTSLIIDVVTTVANSDNVSVSVDPTAFVTKGEFIDLQEDVNNHTHHIAGTLVASEYKEYVQSLMMVTSLHPNAYITNSMTANSYTCEGNGTFDIGVCYPVNPEAFSSLVVADNVYVEIEGYGKDAYPSIACVDETGQVYHTILSKDLTGSTDKSFYFKWKGLITAWLRVYLSAGSITFTSFKISEPKEVDGFMSVEDKRKLDSIPEGGGSADLSDYVKNTDYATADKGGVVKVYAGNGVSVFNGQLGLVPATNAQIDGRKAESVPITPKNLEYAVKSVGDGYYATEAEVEEALDAILAIQSSLIGGAE